MKPYLFLDVDGVVAPILPSYFPIPDDYFTWDTAPWNVCVHRMFPAWAEHLDSVLEVVWCTDWQEMAPERLGTSLGLPVWPALIYGDGSDGRGRLRHKAAAICQLVETDPRPFAWVDDALNQNRLPPALKTLISRLDLPVLALPADPQVGLTEHMVDRLMAFASHSAVI